MFREEDIMRKTKEEREEEEESWLNEKYNKAGEELRKLKKLQQEYDSDEEKDIIEPEDFKKKYGEKEVEKDKQETKRLKDIFEERGKENPEEEKLKKFATIFEVEMLEQGEQSDWFGENAHTIKTCDYDDYKNGVDIIIEWKKEKEKQEEEGQEQEQEQEEEQEEEEEASYLGLAVDVTTSSDRDNKWESIWKELQDGKLGEIKYFDPSLETEEGGLENLPRVVVRADPKDIKEVADMKKRDIAKHPMHIKMLEQIEGQLEAFQEWAKEHEKESLAEELQERLEIVQDVLTEKEELVNELKDQGVLELGEEKKNTKESVSQVKEIMQKEGKMEEAS